VVCERSSEGKRGEVGSLIHREEKSEKNDRGPPRRKPVFGKRQQGGRSLKGPVAVKLCEADYSFSGWEGGGKQIAGGLRTEVG